VRRISSLLDNTSIFACPMLRQTFSRATAAGVERFPNEISQLDRRASSDYNPREISDLPYLTSDSKIPRESHTNPIFHEPAFFQNPLLLLLVACPRQSNST
jgi:hypothetical protein